MTNILFCLKVLHPDFFYLTSGNHEFESLCGPYGFKKVIVTYHNPKNQSENDFEEERLSLKKSKSLIIDVNN